VNIHEIVPGSIVRLRPPYHPGPALVVSVVHVASNVQEGHGVEVTAVTASGVRTYYWWTYTIESLLVKYA
jgi:hypothetical protein